MINNKNTLAKHVGCVNFLSDGRRVEEVKENLANNEPFN